MTGFWEWLLILAVIGYFVYPWYQKRQKRMKERKANTKGRLKREEIIDLDESSYEIYEAEDES